MILRRLGALDIVGGDVVEVAPAYDHADITSIAGAAVMQHYLGLLADRKKQYESLASSDHLFSTALS